MIKNKQCQNLYCIMFGPTDVNEKTTKISQLLTTKVDGNGGNIALKTVNDLFNIKESILKEY